VSAIPVYWESISSGFLLASVGVLMVCIGISAAFTAFWVR
jgi:hypothetical protein